MPLLPICVKIIVNTILVLKAGVIYFALVFGLGFLLGSIRVSLLVPRFSMRKAELLEAPFMVVGIIFAAQFVVKNFTMPQTVLAYLSMGLLALGLVLMAEVMLIKVLQTGTIRQSVARRDPVSGSVYLMMLLIFALMLLVILLNKR